MKKYIPVISIVFFIILLASYWAFPDFSRLLGILFLIFILAAGVWSIFSRHSGQESARLKISKDVLLLVLTILLVSFLGGLAGLFANQYATMQFGETAGFVSALVAGLLVGYIVRLGMGKLVR